jgi:predicted O-linked N-acetylglucosamine transferase (SPINDLY family)
LRFAPRLPKDRHLARLARADLTLDTRTYNGHTTTIDSLWAGVPVVTVLGGHFASRVSASLLGAIGLPELVASDLAGYERIATELAREPEKLAALRAKLAANRRTQSLFDTAGFVRGLERAYRRMSELARAGRPPEPIDLRQG